MLSTSSAAEIPKCKYNKSSIKTGSPCNAATYYFSSIKRNAWILLVTLSLNPPPDTL